MTFNKKVKKGLYYLTSNWEFRYAPTEDEVKANKPIKYWWVEDFEDFDDALEEAGAIHCKMKGIKISKIPIIGE